jgi:hypothetical protein
LLAPRAGTPFAPARAMARLPNLLLVGDPDRQTRVAPALDVDFFLHRSANLRAAAENPVIASLCAIFLPSQRVGSLRCLKAFLDAHAESIVIVFVTDAAAAVRLLELGWRVLPFVDAAGDDALVIDALRALAVRPQQPDWRELQEHVVLNAYAAACCNVTDTAARTGHSRSTIYTILERHTARLRRSG